MYQSVNIQPRDLHFDIFEIESFVITRQQPSCHLKMSWKLKLGDKHSQAFDDLYGLGEISLVRNLDDVSPDALVVLGEDGSDVLHRRGARGHWAVHTVQLGARHIRIASSPIADLVLPSTAVLVTLKIKAKEN